MKNIKTRYALEDELIALFDNYGLKTSSMDYGERAMRTYKEQRLAEREDFRKFVASAVLAVLGVLFVVWVIGYGIVHYQSGMNTCIGKGYTKSYCQYLLK